jgi:transposase InsO family protein
VWATDITYIPMAKRVIYLTAIIDLHTRFVLNWSVTTVVPIGVPIFCKNYTKVWCA